MAPREPRARRSALPYFLAMFSILSFFFMRGLEAVETEVSTREEVDCDT